MEEQYVNSLVGNRSIFRGDIEVEGLVRIDGDFVGTVRKAGRVLIGSQGRADATLHAKVVVIGGAFHGSVYASERIILLGSSLVLGNLYAPRILVEQGAILECGLSILGESKVETQTRTNTFFRRKDRKKSVGETQEQQAEPANVL